MDCRATRVSETLGRFRESIRLVGQKIGKGELSLSPVDLRPEGGGEENGRSAVGMRDERCCRPLVRFQNVASKDFGN